MDKQQEDPELDFTNFLEKQKEKQSNTPVPLATEAKASNTRKPLPKMMIRGIVFFSILLLLMGALIVLYINRPKEGALERPEGYRVINNPNEPPRIERIK